MNNSVANLLQSSGCLATKCFATKIGGLSVGNLSFFSTRYTLLKVPLPNFFTFWYCCLNVSVCVQRVNSVIHSGFLSSARQLAVQEIGGLLARDNLHQAIVQRGPTRDRCWARRCKRLRAVRSQWSASVDFAEWTCCCWAHPLGLPRCTPFTSCDLEVPRNHTCKMPFPTPYPNTNRRLLRFVLVAWCFGVHCNCFGDCLFLGGVPAPIAQHRCKPSELQCE